MSGDAWQQERSQLRAKLAQAGNHLKTLTQENASLKKRIAMEEKQRKDLEETRKKDLDTANQTKTELVSLLQEYFKEPVTIDVSNPVQLKEYFENVKVRLQEQTAQNDESDTIAALKSQIEQLKIQGSSTENIVTNSCDIKTVDESLKDIVMDPENASLNSSLPPGLLRTLENLRGHLQQQALSLAEMKTQNASMAENAQKDLKRQITQLQLSNNEMMEQNDKLTTDKEELERRLKECEETAKRISEESELKIAALKQEHKSLLDKLAHIKNTLAPRLEADKQLRLRNTELTTELETTQQELEHLRRDLLTRDEETGQIIAQKERDMSQLQMRLEKVQREREEVEMMAMQMDARRSQLEEQAESTQSELRRLQTRLQEEQEEKESERASLANLQTVLEEFQATKDAEIRAAVEHIERQLEVAKKSWNEYQERARVAEASLEQYQRDVAKAQQYEREIKEKNLLIGKLRHEAIILNEHLVEAMRRLKEESSENNVDRQLITNLLVGFFLAPRGERKRYDILTIIASVLQLTDEQREQIGLIRSSNKSSQRSSPSTTGWQSPQPEEDSKEVNDLAAGENGILSLRSKSFTDAWISFLLKESSTHRPSTLSASSPSDKLQNNP